MHRSRAFRAGVPGAGGCRVSLPTSKNGTIETICDDTPTYHLDVRSVGHSGSLLYAETGRKCTMPSQFSVPGRQSEVDGGMYIAIDIMLVCNGLDTPA